MLQSSCDASHLVNSATTGAWLIHYKIVMDWASRSGRADLMRWRFGRDQPNMFAGIVDLEYDRARCCSRPRSLSDLFHACVAAQKAPMQGARSAIWLVQMSDEQRGRGAFWAATRRASLALGALRRCKALVVNDTTARFAPCTASQSEARAYAKQVRQAPRRSRQTANEKNGPFDIDGVCRGWPGSFLRDHGVASCTQRKPARLMPPPCPHRRAITPSADPQASAC